MELLQQSLIKVNEEYFSFQSLPHICLSKGQDKSQRKAIVFGTFHTKKNEIKIHPVLIQNIVPDFVLEFVIYHEMLHYQDRSQLQKRKKGERIHTSVFRQREKQFAHYNAAQKILKKILYGEKMLEQSASENSKNRIPLSGIDLELALTESLNHLDQVLKKYDIITEKIKGAKRGSQKNNDQDQLARSM